MNSLAFAILGVLARKPQSGYELGKQLEFLWAANLSQIYPLLSKIEKNGYATSERVEQSGKPDKINYIITEKGLDCLQEWLKKEPSHPIIRDEFLTKVFSLWLTDLDTAIHLLEERRLIYEEKVNYFNESINDLKSNNKIALSDITTTSFSRYILLKRRVKMCQDEVEWCEWVLDLLKNQMV